MTNQENNQTKKPDLKSHLEINGRTIGPGNPAYIIAEISANHNQDFDRAIELVQLAHRSGADAVKLQTYTADTLTLDSDQPHFRINQGTVWDGSRLYDLYKKAYTPWDWQPKLMKLANRLGMDLFSSPFDATAVDFLESMNVPAYKIASFEIIDVPLLRKVAATGKPVIVSTGMATLEEIEQAVEILQVNGCDQIALLKCTSAYPAPVDAMNLKTIADLKTRFQVPVGLSDHTLASLAPVVSVCLGGTIIEKHLTYSRFDKGPDSSFSLEPAEFAEMVNSVREAEKASGSVRYGTTPSDENNLSFRRSLFAVQDIEQGEQFTAQNVRSIRPGQGLEPTHIDRILTSHAAVSIARGTPLNWRHVA